MDTDRELLDLAGQAIGEHYDADRNPLEQDSLVLVLIAKLGVLVEANDQVVTAHPQDTRVTTYRRIDGDLCAAIRQAVVRAAAEVGGMRPASTNP